MPEKESFDIDGLMVFKGDYTAKDQDGNVVTSVITPDRYKQKDREPLSSEQTGRYTNTTAYWKDHSDIVPTKGDMYIYSDGGSIEQGGVTVNIPKIKIGDGVTTIDNLPFTDSDNQGGGEAGTLDTTNTSAQTPNASESLSGNVNLHKVAKTGSYDDLLNKPTIPTVNDAVLTIQRNGTTVDTFSANASQNKTINITVPTTASDVSALPSNTKYGAALSLSINSSTYVVTAQLKDQDGNNLGSAQTIDLPLESVVVSGSYNAQTKKVVLTLQNGSTIEFSVADLVAGLQSEITAQNPLSADLVTDGTTNKVFTSAEKTKLAGIESGAEVNVQADWSETDTTSDAYILHRPAIPSKTSDLNNDSGFITASDIPQELFVCTFTGSSTITCDKTVAQISEAWQNKKIVIGFSGASCFFLQYINRGLVIFFNIISANGTSIDRIMSSDGGSTWSKTSMPVQEKLTSGTNIKTINGNSLLGSGDLTVGGGDTNVQSDWNQTDNTADDYIKNKPNLATVATSGDYDDLTNKPTMPTVPTNVSAFANDAGYITNSDLPTIDTELSETSTNPVQNQAIGIELRKLWNNVDVQPRLDVEYMSYENYIATPTETGAGTWRTNSIYRHWAIPIDGMRLVEITANNDYSAWYTFLKSHNSYTGGTTPDYATGYNELKKVDKETSTKIPVPFDANYIYINTGNTSSSIGTSTPSHIYMTGIGITAYNGNGSGFVKDNGVVDKSTYLKQSDLPAIPSKTSDLTNDSGFITLNDIPSQEQSDWNEADTTDPAYIKNKPALFSGDYNDLSNKPTIPTVPTNVSSFTNDAGYLTQETDPIFSAWDKDYDDLTNTPVGGNGIELKSLVSDNYNVIIWSANESNTYINTGIAMSQDDIEMELVVKPTIGSWYIWQTRPSGGSTTGISGSSTNDTITFAFCGTTLTSGIRRYANTAYKYLVRAKAKNGSMSLYVKRLDTGVDDTKTGTYTYTQQTLPLYMFGNQRGDRVNRGNYIYSAKMWLGGKLVLEYVPVMRKSDDTIMFFDTRTQNYITPNSGSMYKASEDYLLPTPLAINAIAKGITIYSGSSAPSSVIGADGDIYIQEVV